MSRVLIGGGREMYHEVHRVPPPMTVLRTTPDLVLRRLEERDVPILARWRSDPRVMESYAVYRGPVTETQVRSDFFGGRPSRDRATGRFFEYRACMVEERGTPVAFVQYHRLRASDLVQVGSSPSERSYELDLFVGDVDRWGQGLGPRVIEMARDFLIEARGAVRVIAIPYADNSRSSRAFEKAGFRRTRTIRGAYAALGRGDGILMEYR